jgi:hypothetical protein
MIATICALAQVVTFNCCILLFGQTDETIACDGGGMDSIIGAARQFAHLLDGKWAQDWI